MVCLRNICINTLNKGDGDDDDDDNNKWNQAVNTEKEVTANRPYIIITNKKNRKHA
jgi:hypothetical protein